MSKKFVILSAVVVAVFMIGAVTANASGRSQLANVTLLKIAEAEQAMRTAAVVFNKQNGTPARSANNRQVYAPVPAVDPNDPEPELVAYWQGVEYLQKSIALYNDRDYAEAIHLAEVSQNFLMFSVKLATD